MAIKSRVIESMADCVVGDRVCVAIVAEVEVWDCPILDVQLEAGIEWWQ